MRPTSLYRAIGAAALLFSLTTFAHAGEPEPQDRHPGRSSALPTLDQTFGVDMQSSQPGTGFAGMSPDKLDEYVKSVQSVNIAVAFHTDKNHTTDIGDTSHWHVHHLGPVPIPVPNLNPGLQVRGDSEVRLSASYSKKNGEDTATLDDIKLQAPAVHFGPFGLLSVQNAEVKSNGEIDLKLNRFLPTMKVTQITRDSDGDVHLHIKWAPDVYITPKGDVQIHVGPSFCHFTQTIGHVSVNLFAEWPPSLKDFLGAAGAPMASQTGGIVGALDPNTKRIVDSLAGNATFDLHAKTDGTPIDYNGTTAKADAQIDIHGDGRIQDGQFFTVGDKNTANVKLDVGGMDANLPNGDGAKVDKASLSLGGHYQLTVPMDDPTKHLVVDFNGKAGVSASGKDAHLTLPNGASIRVASFDGSADVGLKFHDGADGKRFQLENGNYSLGAAGPIHVENLGKISSLDMDGQIHSQGTLKIGPTGLAQLTGDLRGQGELASDLPVDLNGTKTTIKKGSTLDLGLDHFDAAVSLPFAAGQSGPPALVHAHASGDVGVHGALGDAVYTKNGITVHSSGAAVDLNVHGSADVTPGSLAASGHMTGNAKLEGPTSVDATLANGARIRTTLASGSNVSLDGDVAKSSSGFSASGTLHAHAPVGTTTIEQNGLTVRAPSGALDLSLSGKTGSSGTRGHYTANASLGNGTKVDYVGGPYGSSVHTMLTAGSQFGVSGDLAGNMLTGTLKGQVDASGIDGGLGPATIHLPADAQIGVTAPFGATLGSNGSVALNTAHATVPIHVAIHKGTTVGVSIRGITGGVTLDTEGTYVDLVAQADIVNGKPVIRSLDNCTINLVLGDAAAQALSHQVGFPVDKRLTFKGNAALRPNGLDLHGNVSFGQKGQSSSWFSFSW